MNCTILSKRGASASPLGTVLALGCFDGFHRGHRALIKQAAAIAEERSAPLAIWSPAGIKKAGGRLFERSNFLSLAASLGVDLLIEEDFEEIRTLSGGLFFERYILNQYHPVALVCGENFRFGAEASCGIEELAAFCDAAGLALYVCRSVVDDEGNTVSSTAVKNALSNGQPEKARALLGAPYSLTATVSKGRQVGRRLGFPTLNFPLPADCPLKFGVYFAKVTTPAGCFPAAVNVGVHPTFGRDAAPVLEAHLLKKPEQSILYGDSCTVSFLAFRRPEIRFSSPEDLQKTVFDDLAAGKAFFNLQE